MNKLFFAVRLPTLAALFWRRHIARERVGGISRKEPLSFIIYRLDALGDVVLTTPLFRALKKAYPGSRCTVVVQERYKSLLATNPNIDKLLTLPKVRPDWLPGAIKRWLSAVRFYWTHLRRRHFDFAIAPRWDVDEHLATMLCILTSAARRVGYTEETTPAKRSMNRGFDEAFNICLPAGPARHEVLRNLAIAEAAGATELDARLDVVLTDRDRRKATKLLASVPPSTKLIAVGIGARSPGRRWPVERHAATLTQLAREYSVQPVIVCSKEERSAAARLASHLENKPILLCGAPLREVCAVLERCELFLGNDSGCAHLAAAMDCRVIVISRHPRNGNTNHFNSPLRFSPHCSHARVLQPATGMEGCESACRSLEPHCIFKVSVDEAVAAARKLLGEKRVNPASQFARPWSEKASQRLLGSHSAEGIRRAASLLALHGTTTPN